MGLLGQLLGKITGKPAEGGDQTQSQNALLESAMAFLNNPQAGGVKGVLEKFTSNGLGETVASWISTGKNLPISAEQLQSVLGSGQIQQIAEKIGLSKEAVSNGLAAIFPQIVDKLTPNGKLPEDSSIAEGLDQVKKDLMTG